MSVPSQAVHALHINDVILANIVLEHIQLMPIFSGVSALSFNKYFIQRDIHELAIGILFRCADAFIPDVFACHSIGSQNITARYPWPSSAQSEPSSFEFPKYISSL